MTDAMTTAEKLREIADVMHTAYREGTCLLHTPFWEDKLRTLASQLEALEAENARLRSAWLSAGVDEAKHVHVQLGERLMDTSTKEVMLMAALAVIAVVGLYWMSA